MNNFLHFIYIWSQIRDDDSFLNIKSYIFISLRYNVTWVGDILCTFSEDKKYLLATSTILAVQNFNLISLFYYCNTDLMNTELHSSKCIKCYKHTHLIPIYYSSSHRDYILYNLYVTHSYGPAPPNYVSVLIWTYFYFLCIGLMMSTKLYLNRLGDF